MKLSDSLAQNNAIQLQAEAADWRQAVRLGSICWWPPAWWNHAISTPFWPASNGTALTSC